MSNKNLLRPKVVSTMTPQRISFFGGGTDFPGFFSEQNGEVINSAIDKYIYVTVKQHSPLFNEAYRLNYSKTENVQSLDEIENSIARECLRLLNVEPPLYIGTIADIPTSSGLGSSSSFAVGLLHALHILKGNRPSPAQLAEEACEVEIQILGHPIGKQDQYAAAFGGLNHISFKKNGRVQIDQMHLESEKIDLLFNHCLLVWSGKRRDSSTVLEKQNNNLNKHLNEYILLTEYVKSCKKILLKSSLDVFINELAALLEKSWDLKKGLENSISSSEIDRIHSLIQSSGGLGGKLSGAGGGGFLLELVPINLQTKITEIIGLNKVLKVEFEPLGSRLLYVIY